MEVHWRLASTQVLHVKCSNLPALVHPSYNRWHWFATICVDWRPGPIFTDYHCQGQIRLQNWATMSTWAPMYGILPRLHNTTQRCTHTQKKDNEPKEHCYMHFSKEPLLNFWGWSCRNSTKKYTTYAQTPCQLAKMKPFRPIQISTVLNTQTAA